VSVAITPASVVGGIVSQARNASTWVVRRFVQHRLCLCLDRPPHYRKGAKRSGSVCQRHVCVSDEIRDGELNVILLQQRTVFVL
jgi:hypothetical protein